MLWWTVESLTSDDVFDMNRVPLWNLALSVCKESLCMRLTCFLAVDSRTYLRPWSEVRLRRAKIRVVIILWYIFEGFSAVQLGRVHSITSILPHSLCVVRPPK